MTERIGGRLERHGRGAKQQVDRAAHSRTMELLARLGLVGKGLIYVLLGVLAVRVAAGDAGTDSTDKSGALHTVAEQPLGKVMLLVLAVLLVAYAAWRIVGAVAGTGEDGATDWAKRAGMVGRAVLYGALALLALSVAFGGSSSGGAGSEDSFTARVMDWPAGRVLVALGGLAVIGAGCWSVHRALTRGFEKGWRTEQMSPLERRIGDAVGIAGHLARAVTWFLIGAFLVRAAWEYDPEETVGLDGALAKLAQGDAGPWLLGLTALGLVAYGVYCFVDARWVDVDPEAE